MKTILFVLIVILFLASCSAPVTRPENHPVAIDSIRVDSTMTKPHHMTSELALGSILFLIVLYIVIGPKN